MKPKKKYSPHLSIKRLRDLALAYSGKTKLKLLAHFEIQHFIDFVEESRPSLAAKKLEAQGVK